MNCPRFRAVVRAAAIIAVGLLVGCANKRGLVRGGPVAIKPPELQAVADLQPPLSLPTPATQPAGPASADALEAYARGRDALLRNQKANASKHLTEAVGLDAGSAVVWRDLGYARIGSDDAKAAAAFRTAADLDPLDADSRLQLARLLLADNRTDAAIKELRLARLSPEYADNGGLAAVVDLLLGQSLEAARYRTAALECYGNVLAILDDDGVDLRGRPELNDVLQRPGLLILRTADLATQCGRYAVAIDLYTRLQRQEPQSADTLELRIARAEMASGDHAKATKRAVEFVRKAGASHLAMVSFDELFEPYGGATAALAELAKVRPPRDFEFGDLLRSHLLLASGDAAGAVDAVSHVRRSAFDGGIVASKFDGRPGLPLVRQTVHAYRAAGREADLLRDLLRRTTDAANWHVWERGWETLTHLAQPSPLTPERLLAVDISKEPAGVMSARAFVVSQMYAKSGRTAAARKWAAAAAAGPSPFDIAAAEASPAIDLTDPGLDNSKDLAVVLDDYRDDPELLMTVVAGVLRDGQKRLAVDALAAVAKNRPTDPVIATSQAQLLAADGRRAEAGAALDKAAAAATSANMLYALASQYTAIGDDKSAERLLRRAHAVDAAFAPACNDLGYLLTDQGRDLPFAEQLLTRAAAAEPDNAAYLDSLGWLLYKRAKFGDAAKRLEEAVAAAVPVDAVVLDHAGDALYQAQQQPEAAARWQQAVDAIKQRGTADPQLRLRIEQKLRQLKDKSPVVVAPVAKAE